MKAKAKKKVALFTVGCKLNQYETQAMGELLEKDGFERVDFKKPADLYIINTCTVTGQSDYSSRQAIYRAKRWSPFAKIIVTGCYAELKLDFLKNLPGVSKVFGNERKKNIAQIALSLFDSKRLDFEEDTEELKVKGHFNHTRALVKIQDGCNQSCSYCVVPLVRGKERSRDSKQIIEEVENLVSNGFKEVVLTGVHVGRYDFCGEDTVTLTKKILDYTSIKRIRYSSIEPNEIPFNLIDLIAKEKRICKHLHVPLQSGDDEILKLMNRSYNTEYYKDLLSKIVEAFPFVTIGADVIVGFPGETERHFENTYKFIQSLPLPYLHIFSYSKREGTKASFLKDKVDPKTIKKRSEILHKLAREKWEKFLDSFIGKNLEVLIEKRRDRKTKKLIGLSDNYIRVLVQGEDELFNQIVEVFVKKREGRFLIGKVNGQ